MGLETLSQRAYPPDIPRSIEIPSWRVEDLLRQAAVRYPDHQALAFYDQDWSYQTLWHAVLRMARAFQDRGLRSGDRVALMLPNCPQYVVSYYAVLLAGGIVTQVNPMLVERELLALLEDSGSRIIVAFDALLPRIEALRPRVALEWVVGVSFAGRVDRPEVLDFEEFLSLSSSAPPSAAGGDPEDVAVLQYTGGTTGHPKGAMLTHRNLVANVLQIRAFTPALQAGAERCLSVIPLFHVYGMTVCMNVTLSMGGCLVLLPRFDLAEVLRTIRQGVTNWPGVPTMYTALLQVPELAQYGVNTIRSCLSGSAPMPVELMQKFEAVTGAPIAEGYGLTEASPVTHSNPLWGVRKPGTVGLSYPSTEYRIVNPDTGEDVSIGEVGELWIRGPQVMKGYWNQPLETEATLTKEGWLRTGDLATVDGEGYVSIVDRLKDLIIASGYNVYPREVEEVIYQHPCVLEAVVVGAPDPYRGETVRAVIVPKPGVVLSRAEMDAYLKANLAPYKCPKIIEFRDALPKSAIGKILRRVVREEAERHP
ncbi:MAG: long-chain fatty acid--CoA ligase [Firmicutes bacterium]|nr:long-chain fatty acid--CoA ligase [Bacillota bacterium]